MNWRESCLWRISSAGNTSADIVNELTKITRELGFEYCSYVMRLPFPIHAPSVVWASSYPQRWIDCYLSSNYLDIDPLLARIAHDSSPVAWTHRTFKTQPAFWEDARAHGVRYGWATATGGTDHTLGMLSLARSHDALCASELDESETKLVWLAHAAHGAISNLEMRKYRPAPGRELSAREREVLRWTAAGKTAGEIATILGITERTVGFHVASALQKLNAVNKTQAVMTAMALNLLL